MNPLTLNSNPDFWRKMHYYWLLSKKLDEKAIALQRTGRLGTYPSSHGHEAVFLSAAAALEAGDQYVPYYRDHPAFLFRGMPIHQLLWYWAGDIRGASFNHQPQDWPINVPIASQVPHAVGLAYANRQLKNSAITLVTLGDGATSKGDCYEAMNMAAIHNLPVVFYINNNQWAISVPLHQQSGSSNLEQKITGIGIESQTVDGYDCFSTYHSTKKAVDKCRSGMGPQCVIACTTRITDHTTADDSSKYLPLQDEAHKKTHDSLPSFQKTLLENKIISQAQLNQDNQDSQKELDREVEQFLHTEPNPHALNSFLFAKRSEAS